MLVSVAGAAVSGDLALRLFFVAMAFFARVSLLTRGISQVAPSPLGFVVAWDLGFLPQRANAPVGDPVSAQAVMCRAFSPEKPNRTIADGELP